MKDYRRSFEFRVSGFGFRVPRVALFAVYCLLLAVFCLLPASALAQDEVSDNEVNEVAKDLFCPVCESTPLDVCPTQACADWRELIREKLGQGQNKQDIMDYFARQYGDGVLATPPKRGLNWVVWLFPIVAVPLGVLFFARFLRGIKATPAVVVEDEEEEEETAVSPATTATDYIQRIEQELHTKGG